MRLIASDPNKSQPFIERSRPGIRLDHIQLHRKPSLIRFRNDVLKHSSSNSTPVELRVERDVGDEDVIRLSVHIEIPGDLVIELDYLKMNCRVHILVPHGILDSLIPTPGSAHALVKCDMVNLSQSFVIFWSR